MKRITIFLLLFAAMLGLAAQAPARALAPDADANVAAAMAAMPNCMEKMDHKSSDSPCGCTRADCIAAMLGSAPLFTAVDPVGTLAAHGASAIRPIAAQAVPLIGKSLGPEPPPPNRLI